MSVIPEGDYRSRLIAELARVRAIRQRFGLSDKPRVGELVVMPDRALTDDGEVDQDWVERHCERELGKL